MQALPFRQLALNEQELLRANLSFGDVPVKSGLDGTEAASEPLRDRTEGDAVDESHVSGTPRALMYPSIRSRNGMRATDWLRCGPSRNVGEPPPSNTEIPSMISASSSSAS